MNFAKLSRNLTACMLLSVLFGCSSHSPTSQTGFNRSEAVKARINLALAYLDQNNYRKQKRILIKR